MEVWQHRPQGGVIESLEWSTDIVPCKRAEYRYNRRQLPRQTFSCKYQMTEAEYCSAREKARRIGGDELYVPDWPRLIELPAIGPGTATLPINASHISSYKSNGKVLLLESYSHFEVCTIVAIGTGTVTISPTTQSYNFLTAIPLRVGTFAQPFTTNRPAAFYNEPQALFSVTATEDMFDSSLDTYPSFLGYPLVTPPREEIHSVEDSTTRAITTFDSQTGPVANYAVLSYATTAMGLSITAQTADAALRLRSFLASLCGRWKAFWLSSWNADVQVVQTIGVGYAAVPIAAIGAASVFALPAYFTIHTSALDYVAFRVDSVSTGTGGTEYLHVDSVLTVRNGVAIASSVFLAEVPLSSIAKTSKITLSRLDADRIEFQYGAGLSVKVVVPTQEVPL